MVFRYILGDAKISLSKNSWSITRSLQKILKTSLLLIDLAAPKDIPKPVVVAEPVVPDPLPNQDKVNFKDVDNAIDVNGNKSDIIAPKTDERLEEIANLSAERRKREEEEEEEEEKIKIGDSVSLDIMDVNDLNKPMAIESSPILNDIEVLS